MQVVRILLLLVHISFAAILFGGGLGLRKAIESSLAVSPAALRATLAGTAQRAKLMGISSILTLLTGVALIFVSYGGFKEAPKNYHTALLLMLGAVAVSGTIQRPTMLAIVAEAAREVPDGSVIGAKLKKLSMAQGILHLLWIVTLTLMFARFG